MRGSDSISDDRTMGHLARRPRLLHRPGSQAADLLQPPRHGATTSLIRRMRVIRRGVSIVAWTLLCMVVQAIFLLMPGRAKVAFARFFWRGFTWLMGFRVRVVGDLASTRGGRPVMFVSNHSSWVDIPIIGGILDGCFVAKGEVAGWPLIGTIARLGRTVFVSRQRGSTGRELDAMRDVLAHGDNLILFPEGTSSDGCRVLPFRSSFLALAEAPPHADRSRLPIIQPVSVVYDRLGGLPIGRASRPLFAWYGDMDIASHFWRLAQHVGLRVTVVLHPPLDPAVFPNRKALTHTVWRTVADGASTLRQNRPIDPAATAGNDPGVSGSTPAYA